MMAKEKSRVSRVDSLPKGSPRSTESIMMRCFLLLLNPYAACLCSRKKDVDPSNGCSHSVLEWRSQGRNIHATTTRVCRAWQGEAGLQTKEVTLRIKVIPTLLEREVLQPSETSWFQAEWS